MKLLNNIFIIEHVNIELFFSFYLYSGDKDLEMKLIALLC